MIIYFLRHASAGTKLPNAKKDERRPLDEDGVLQSQHVGRFLAELGVKVEAIISSPLTRATQTASLVAGQLEFQRDLQIDDALRPESELAAFHMMLSRLRKYEAVIIVGHNPSLTEFLSKSLASESTATRVELKKGAVAKVEFGGKNGTLKWLVTAKIARTVQRSLKLSSRPKTSRK